MNGATPHNRMKGSDGHRSSRGIEREIEKTRSEIDRTLEAIGDRLSPRHLFEEALDLFRPDRRNRQEYVRQARNVGMMTLRKIRQHPIPALLCGAGLAWYMFEEDEGKKTSMREQWDDLPEHSGSFVDARTGQPYDENYARDIPPAAAWDEKYDWTDAEYDEQTWTERANKTIADLRELVNRPEGQPQEKIRAAAERVISVAGRRRSEIRAQWDDLPEHSGSFVDARTGEPYDETYGREWRTLAACDVVATEQPKAKDEQTWGEQARQTLEKIQHALSDSTASAKQTLNTVASHIGSYAEQTYDMTARSGRSTRSGMGRAVRGIGRSAASAQARLGRSAASTQARLGRTAASAQARLGRSAAAAQAQLSSGYRHTRETFEEVLEDYPVAVGAAVLGLGLLAGALLPSTRREDRLMGDASDDVKRRARHTAEGVAERGREVVSSAAHAVSDEMQRQGLTAEEAARKTRQATSRVAEALDQTAEEAKAKVSQVAKTAAESTRTEAYRPR